MEIIGLIFLIVIFLFSAVLHEVAHGWTANLLGDPTAKNEGRLSLNPLRHLDPMGSVIVPLFLILMSRTFGGGFIIGWARPVPFNPLNLKNQKRDLGLVALAGPVVNLTAALVFGLMTRGLLLWQGVQNNFYWSNLVGIFAVIVWVNLLLAFFNLMPIPPLDGSKILFALLPATTDRFRFTLERYGLLFLVIFIFIGFPLITSLAQLAFKLLVGQSFA